MSEVTPNLNVYKFTFEETPWWISMVWSRPRIDFSFQLNNATWQSIFNTSKGDTYIESALFYMAIPIVWLLLTLLMFLAYFCYRCCQRDIEKKRKVYCARFLLVFFSVFICIIAAIGLFSNQLIYTGLSKVEHTIKSQTEHSNQIDNQVKTKMNQYKTIHVDNSAFIINLIKAETKLSSKTKVDIIKQASYLEEEAIEVQHKLKNISTFYSTKNFLQQLAYILQSYIEMSWISMMCYLIFVVFISVLLIFGVIFSSKCTLLIYCSFAILTMVLCYMISSHLIGSIIIASDICMDSPEKILSGMLLHFPLSYTNKERPADFSCIPNSLSNISFIENRVNLTRQTVISLDNAINDAKFKSSVSAERYKSYKQLINNCLAVDSEPWATNLSVIASHFCNASTRKMYIISNRLCKQIVPGYDIIVICLLSFGLLLTLTTIIASRAWRNFGSNKRMFSHHASAPDENDYLMYGDEYPSQQYSFSRGRQGNPREHISMQQRRNTPPPAYKALNQQQQQQQQQHPSEEITPLEPIPPTPEHHRRYAAMGYGCETDA